MRRVLTIALCLAASPVFAQALPGQPDWKAVAVALRQQREQASDAAVEAQVKSVAQIAAMQKQAADLAKYWADYVKGLDTALKP